MDAIYEYPSSPAFARRIRSAVESFMQMKDDLDSERRAIEKRWSKRAAQLDQLAANTAGMYGELEALMGSALPSVDVPELPAPALEVAARSAA